MADPFQPRFVDLVRNFTSTAGTGNLVLDDPAPGFTSFGSALQTGDQFYYSVAGLDNISESEVGRGTIQADGTIARQPLGGALTNFSTGRKTVALVAAAEWFESIEAGRGGGGIATAESVATLRELTPGGATVLTQAGREGLFLFDPGNLADEVAADTASAIYVAPSSDPTGVSGAWVREFDGWLRPEWFGAAGDGVSDDHAAFRAMSSLIAQAGHGQISLAAKATYLVGNQTTGGVTYLTAESPLEFDGLSSLIVAMNGATLKTRGGLKFGTFDPVTGEPTAGSSTSTTAPSTQRAHIGMTIRATNVGMVRIADGFLDGNSAAQTIGGPISSAGWQFHHYGLFFRNCGQVVIDNVEGSNFLLDCWKYDQDGLTEDDDPRPFQMHNCRFYNAGRNVGTIGGGNAITLLNCGHKNNGAPIAGGGRLTSGPGAAIDLEVTTAIGLIRNVRIIGGVYEQGASGLKCIIADSGDTADVSIDGAHLIGELWLDQPRCVVRNCRINGHFTSLYGSGDPQIAALVENCDISDVTAGDTPQLNIGGSIVTGVDGVQMRNCSLWVTVSRIDLDGMITTDNSFTVAIGTDLFPNREHFMLARSGIHRRMTIVDAMASNVPADGYYVSMTTATIEDSVIASASGKLKWMTWSAAGGGYSGRYDNSLLARKALAVQKRLGGSGESFGAASIRFSGNAPADAPQAGSLTFNENPAAGDVIGWRCLDSGSHEPVYGGARALAFHCAGSPSDNETIGGGIAPYPMTLSATGSRCKALAGATGAVTLAIKKNGTQIGQIDFAAAGTVGTISFSTVAVAAGDHITVHNSATADPTLADIDGLLA